MNNHFIASKQESLKPVFQEKEFIGVFQLLKESRQIFRRKLKTLLGIAMFPVGFSLLSLILMYLLGGTNARYSLWFSVLEAISFLGYFFLWLWTVPSLLYTIKEDAGILESYKAGLKILIPYTWVYFLSFIIVAGGYLLLIIPGILFSIWFSLFVYVVIYEEKRGFDTFVRSRQLVAGNFCGVLWRFIALIILIGAGGVIISVIADVIHIPIEVAGYFIELFAFPFLLIYGFLIYRSLKKIKPEMPCQRSSKGTKIKFAIPATLGILCLGLTVSFVFFNIFFGRDEPPIDDSDLWLSKIEIKQEKNAFYYLAEASKKLYLPTNRIALFKDMAEGTKWDIEFAEDLIKNNEEFFEYFKKAVNCSQYQNPACQNPATVSIYATIPWIKHLDDIPRLISIKAAYLFNQGKQKEAFDQYVEIIKIGQLMENAPRPYGILDYAIGVSIKGVGLKGLRGVLPKADLSSETLKNYIYTLYKFKPGKEALVDAFKMEYIQFINNKASIDTAYADKLIKSKSNKIGLEEGFFTKEYALAKLKAMVNLAYPFNGAIQVGYKRNKTQRISAQYYRHAIESIKKAYCSDMKLFEFRRLSSRSPMKMVFTENIAGKVLYDMTIMRPKGLLESGCLVNFSGIATQLLMAIKAYQIETGKIPGSLDDLAPEYIREIPKDPFDGKSIRYLPGKRIIYSVGKDLKDSGGSQGKDLYEMEDPTFEIKF